MFSREAMKVVKVVMASALFCFSASILMAQETEEEAVKRALMVEAAKKQINDTLWEITLTESTDNAKKEVVDDTIKFTNMGRVESAMLMEQGFGASNLTLRIRRENSATWETMQVTEDGQQAFWRGDMRRDPETGVLSETMTGVLSIHKNDKAGTVKNYTFASRGKGAVVEEVVVEEAAVVETPAGEALVVEEVVEEVVETPSGEELIEEEAVEVVPVKAEKPEKKAKRSWM